MKRRAFLGKLGMLTAIVPLTVVASQSKNEDKWGYLSIDTIRCGDVVVYIDGKIQSDISVVRANDREGWYEHTVRNTSDWGSCSIRTYHVTADVRFEVSKWEGLDDLVKRSGMTPIQFLNKRKMDVDKSVWLRSPPQF